DGIEQYCELYQLKPRIDASNREKAYTRNRIRADVIPKLKAENTNMASTIQHLTMTLQEDETFLTNEARRLFPSIVQTNPETRAATISIKGFQACSVSLQRRLFRLTLDYLYRTVPEQITYKHEKAFLGLFSLTGHKVLHFPRNGVMEK